MNFICMKKDCIFTASAQSIIFTTNVPLFKCSHVGGVAVQTRPGSSRELSPSCSKALKIRKY